MHLCRGLYLSSIRSEPATLRPGKTGNNVESLRVEEGRDQGSEIGGAPRDSELPERRRRGRAHRWLSGGEEALQGIEEEFGIYVPMDEKMMELKNVGQVIDTISGLVQAKNAASA